MSESEQYIANTANGSYGKSAYMLIYEKQLKKPIREVDLQAQTQNEEEKVSLLGYRDFEPRIPDWIKSMV